MPSSKQSLIDYLRKSNPSLDNTPSNKGQNTQSIVNKWDEPDVIERWEDFEVDALKSIYGGLLSQILETKYELDECSIPELPFCLIHDEGTFETLLTKWSQSVVGNGLKAAQGRLGRRMRGKHIYMARGGQAEWPLEEKVYRRPDWAGVKQPVRIEKASSRVHNILPGETKVSKKWSSGNINQGDLEESDRAKPWFPPLAQLFTYCVRNNARYGYIITDKELVVVRVRPAYKVKANDGDSQQSNESFDYKPPDNARTAKRSEEPVEDTPAGRTRLHGLLEYRVIHWKAERYGKPGTELMTINLALWWLHMMAADNCIIQDRYSDLRDTQWSGGAARCESQSSSFTEPESSEARRRYPNQAQDPPVEALSLNPNSPERKRTRDVAVAHDDEYGTPESPPQKRTTRSGTFIFRA